MKNGNERRVRILELLEKSNAPLSASKIASEFGITRQVVVADVALLRAQGYAIRAEHLGYVLLKETEDTFRRISCKHSKEDIITEYYAIVDNGGRVLKIMIDHDIYGTLSADVDISSRYDADVHYKKIMESKSEPLSNVTGGVHSHLIAVRNSDCYKRIVQILKEKEILVDADPV